MKKKSIVKKINETKSPIFLVKLGNQKLSGETIMEAFSHIKRELVRGNAVLKVSCGKKKAEMNLVPFQIRRLMLSKGFKILTEKKLMALLK